MIVLCFAHRAESRRCENHPRAAPQQDPGKSSNLITVKLCFVMFRTKVKVTLHDKMFNVTGI